MPENYTLLIIPKKDSSAKKVALSGKIITWFLSLFVIITLSSLYIIYDYINIKRSNVELARLQKQTKEQQELIEALSAKIESVSFRFEQLRQFERKIKIMANLEGNLDKQHLLGLGGSLREENRIKAKLEGDQKELLAEMHREIDQLTEEADLREKNLSEILEFFREQKSLQAATPTLWPVLGWVTSEFGYRISPFTGGREFHAGIDIATRFGKPIIAPADGIVAEVTYRQDLGHTVKIEHGHQFATQYGHLMKTVVKEGTSVKRGQVIGYVGNSGQSTGPHLHYAVFVNGVAINPRKYLN